MSKTPFTWQEEVDFWISEEMHALSHARQKAGIHTYKSRESYKADAIANAKQRRIEIREWLMPEFPCSAEELTAYLDKLDDEIDCEKL